MRNKILYVVLILVVVGAVFLILTKNWNVTSTPTPTPTDEQNTPIIPDLPDISLPFSNDPKDVAWDLFQKYLEFNRQRDLEGVRSVVYKVAAVCDDPKLILDCQNRMGLAYNYGSTLKKQNFVNVWSDERQTILSTNFDLQDTEIGISRNRAILFFIKEGDNLKLLSFSPLKGASVAKGTASQEELLDRVTRYTQDSDEDGLEDYNEECLDLRNQSCVKTDPKVRDTDGDGWWDGIEIYLK